MGDGGGGRVRQHTQYKKKLFDYKSHSKVVSNCSIRTAATPHFCLDQLKCMQENEAKMLSLPPRLPSDPSKVKFP